MSKQNTHTEAGKAPAGTVTLTDASSAGGGSGIYDANSQLKGGEKHSVSFVVEYGFDEENPEKERYAGYQAWRFDEAVDDEPQELELSPEEDALINAAGAIYTELNPMPMPWTYVSTGK